MPLAACRLNYVSNKDDSSDDGSRGTGYAVATFSSRTGALAAIEQLDGLPVKVSPMLSGSIAEYSTFRLRWCLKFPVLRLLDLSPELRHEDLYQGLSSLAELKSVEIPRDLNGVQGSYAIVTFKHRAQACDVQRQLSLNLLMLAGYAIPVCAAFEPGAIDDDFDPVLVASSEEDAGLSSSIASTPPLRCWPDDLLLLGGSLAGGGVGGPGAILVPRQHPAILAVFDGADKSRSDGPVSDLADDAGKTDCDLAGPLVRSPTVAEFVHCGARVTVSKHATFRDSAKNLRRDALSSTGLSGDGSESALPPSRAAARLASVVSQQPRFAQPGSLEFDFACAWRKLQDIEAVERSRLMMEQEERRAELLASQYATVGQIAYVLDGVEKWRSLLLHQAQHIATTGTGEVADLRAALNALTAHASEAITSRDPLGETDDKGSLDANRDHGDDTPAMSPGAQSAQPAAQELLPTVAVTDRGGEASAGSLLGLPSDTLLPPRARESLVTEREVHVEQVPWVGNTLGQSAMPSVTGPAFHLFDGPHVSLPYPDAISLMPSATSFRYMPASVLAASDPLHASDSRSVFSASADHLNPPIVGSLLGDPGKDDALQMRAALLMKPSALPDDRLAERTRVTTTNRSRSRSRSPSARSLTHPLSRPIRRDAIGHDARIHANLDDRPRSRSRSPARKSQLHRYNGSRESSPDRLRDSIAVYYDLLKDRSKQPVLTGTIALPYNSYSAQQKEFFFIKLDPEFHNLPLPPGDIFAHKSELNRGASFRPGARVQFKLAPSTKKASAFLGIDVRIIG